MTNLHSINKQIFRLERELDELFCIMVKYEVNNIPVPEDIQTKHDVVIASLEALEDARSWED